jgi:hypothetical protein
MERVPPQFKAILAARLSRAPTDTRENSPWALKGTQLSHLNAKPLTVLMRSKSPGPTTKKLSSWFFSFSHFSAAPFVWVRR